MECENEATNFKHESWSEPLTDREVDILRLLSEGLTNHEIAHELGLALETVKWYNKRIYSKLGVSNRAQAVSHATTLGLLNSARQEQGTALALPRNNLPAQVTSFVGRQHEIVEVKRLLQEARLLTLIGPAGSGKTRLALWVASELLPYFADGTYFVPLAAVTEVENILWAVTERVGFQFQPKGKPLTQLLEHFRDRKLLLVLDNFEHLLDGAKVLIDILEASPGVKILVTSRERLNLYGEVVYVVGGSDYRMRTRLRTLLEPKRWSCSCSGRDRSIPTWS
jgi:DNA-binding CsgD family transcriptional regulator